MDFELDNGRPGDRRGFFHKKILGIIGKVAGVLPIPGAGIIGTVASTLAGSGRTGERPSGTSAGEKQFGQHVKFPELAFGGGGGGRSGCILPWRPDPVTGECTIFVGDRPGPNGGIPVGDAVMGQYGAGLTPGVMNIRRSVCVRGMQLGNDGLCYNRTQISNKQRMWPKGRRPLLTGGDMRAISIASRAGKRLERTTKRLQTMGMMKKPAPRRIGQATGKALVVKEAGAGSVTVQ